MERLLPHRLFDPFIIILSAFLCDFGRGAGADAVTACFEIGFHSLFCADSAGGFHFDIRSDVLFEKGDILEGRACGAEACGCLDIVGACFCYDLAEADLFFFGEIAGLDDDLEDLILGQSLEGFDLGKYCGKVTVFNVRDVDHHIDFICAVIDGLLGLCCLCLGYAVAQRETDDGGRRCRS